MPNQDRKDLIEEAADIFVRLRENPEDPSILAERRAFLDRGDKEREVYANVIKAWAGTGRKPGPNKPLVMALIAVLTTSAYFGIEPLRILLFADFTTRYETLRVALASDDIVVMDAETALTDNTDGTSRQVRLLEGAALFDVTNDGRAFSVSAGDITIDVLGTIFEVTETGDLMTVSVSEGQVQVSAESMQWTLQAGERLTWSKGGGGDVDAVNTTDIALWRQDRFVADGLTFAQVADVIDRRLPGTVIIGSGNLANSRVAGTFDLDNPELALEALAATRGASIISAPVLGHLFLP